MKFKNILAPTDFSENAGRSVTYARDLARRLSAKLYVLHVPVIPTYVLMDSSYPTAMSRILGDAQQAIDELEPALATSGLDVQTALREGEVHVAIKEYAQEHDVDLLVMATHGRTGVSKLMYGSVTDRTLKTVHVPTIVVPVTGDAAPPTSIVIAYDFSTSAKRAAEAARAIHGVFHGSLHLVHAYLDIWGEYTDRATMVGEAAEKRREALRLGLREMLKADAAELFSIDAQSTQTRLTTGEPVEAVLRVGEEVGATLVAAGTTGKSGIRRLLMGSFARGLLHQSKVPLLFAHSETTLFSGG